VTATAPRRSWLSVRWRQFRHAPRPIVRAVVANLVVAGIGAVPLLAYDVMLSRGASLPGGDQRLAAGIVYVLAVLACGSLLTYLWVPLPSGGSTGRRRTAWSGLLGLFAAAPICYLVLVATFEIVRPLLG
jgi:hypothetical protein